MNSISNIRAITKRELAGIFFSSPVAYVFIVIFLLCSRVPFYIPLGRLFLNMCQANLERSLFHLVSVWLYLFLVPAGRNAACGPRSGAWASIELLLTLPITAWQAIVGKFLRVVGFSSPGALVLTFPVLITVNYLGSPDNGVIYRFCMSAVFLWPGPTLRRSVTHDLRPHPQSSRQPDPFHRHLPWCWCFADFRPPLIS